MQFHQNRILYVEDDEDTRQMMKVLLEMWGYEVVLAVNADEGFRRVRDDRFDLCLLDTRLPDESGLELCKRIRELELHAPVVFVSAQAYEKDKRRGLEAGALAYLTKPVDFYLLKETLVRLITSVSGGIRTDCDAREPITLGNCEHGLLTQLKTAVTARG
jgi:DNA-binding response OmpR family regulator